MKELSLKELQSECLNILKDVHNFCVTNEIKYSVAYGTLIGTLRHKGFIPWDDDVDIIMPRPDYDRFCKIYKSDRFKLKCPENSTDCMIAFARVYDDKRTVVDHCRPWCWNESGVWIDIFPADGVSDDYEAFRRDYQSIWKLFRHLVRARFSCGRIREEDSIIRVIKKVAKRCLFLNGFVAKWLNRELVKRTRSIPFGETGHWGQLSSPDDPEWHDIKTFSSTILMKFEDMEVMVMNGYDEVLHQIYGDYMKLPPEDQREAHDFNKKVWFYWK